ncbi:Protein of uncharacterised function (DUF3631) [Burkholderia pseudomallei]|nr:Protein of uncharacterised function (DUF3631) [Burkholderia pseudomallei]
MSMTDLFSKDPAEWSSRPDDIAVKVAEVRENLTPCTIVHPVAARLGITEPVGYESAGPLMIGGVDLSGALAFRVVNGDRNDINVLFVSELSDGSLEEAFIPGAPFNGGCVRLGRKGDGPVYVVIDIASALAIAKATGAQVACSIYIDNVPDIAATLRKQYPGREIIVCAGPERGMSHGICARAAAQTAAKLAVAESGGTFHGLFMEEGAESLLRNLQAASAPDLFDLPTADPDPLNPPAPTRWPGRINANIAAMHAVILIRRYLVTDVHVAVAMVLWALAGYFVKSIRIAPLFAIMSPTTECGKTVALSLLKSLVCRPYAASNVSAAVLYRMPEPRPTLLIDEFDTVAREKTLMGIINSGHTRTAASVSRIEKGKPISFGTFFMKVVCGIGLLPETLANRSIVIQVERADMEAEPEKHRPSDNDVFAPVRACFAGQAHRHADEVRLAERAPVKLADHRAMDNWEPLFAVTWLLGGHWVEHATRAAKYLSQHTGSESVAGIAELVPDIKDAFESAGTQKLPTQHLLELLAADEEKPWATFSHGKPITAIDLANMLKLLGIRSRDIRALNAEGLSRSLKGYHRDDFTKVFRQYPRRGSGDASEADTAA